MIKGLVTIVLPIYNVEQYLDRCMKSVVDQTYSNIEIIMVDDGSTDSSGKMCEKWARRDKRIQVIHKQNAGLGMARNTGIDIASGEYICFFDSDDYIELDTIEVLYKAIKKYSSEIVTFGFYTVDSSGTVLKGTVPSPPKLVYTGNEIRDEFLPDLISRNPHTGEETNLWMSAWASMYSMELIKNNNWRFVSERRIISEDVYSLLELYENVNCVSVVQRALYYYCENDTASLTRAFRKDRYEKQKEFLFGCLSICDKANYSKDIRERLSYQFMGNSLGAMKRITVSDESIKEKYRDIKKIVTDDVMQKIVSNLDTTKESITRKILFKCIQKKRSIIVYLLLLLQAKRTLN